MRRRSIPQTTCTWSGCDTRHLPGYDDGPHALLYLLLHTPALGRGLHNLYPCDVHDHDRSRGRGPVHVPAPALAHDHDHSRGRVLVPVRGRAPVPAHDHDRSRVHAHDHHLFRASRDHDPGRQAYSRAADRDGGLAQGIHESGLGQGTHDGGLALGSRGEALAAGFRDGDLAGHGFLPSEHRGCGQLQQTGDRLLDHLGDTLRHSYPASQTSSRYLHVELEYTYVGGRAEPAVQMVFQSHYQLPCLDPRVPGIGVESNLLG